LPTQSDPCCLHHLFNGLAIFGIASPAADGGLECREQRMRQHWRCLWLALVVSARGVLIPALDSNEEVWRFLETKDKVVLVLHTSRCKTARKDVVPMIAQIAEAVPGITYARVDVDAVSALNKGAKIVPSPGRPIVKVFFRQAKKGKRAMVYNGDGSYDDLEKWIRRIDKAAYDGTMSDDTTTTQKPEKDEV
jgi:hypothetical protein